MAKNHTAIVYFHGVGEQARYEGVSRLVDALTTYSWNLQDDKAKPLIVTNAKLEQPHEPGIERDIAFLETRYLKEDSVSVFHFYELYWAPLTAGGSAPAAVAFWLLRQVLTSFKATLLSPWRIRQRLRIAALYSYWMRKGMKKYEKRDLSVLLYAYDSFDSHRARKAFPRGSFKEFQKHIPIWLEKSPYDKQASSDDKARIKRLARDWRGAYRYSGMLTTFVILTLFMLIAAGIIAVAYVNYVVYRLVGNLDLINELGDEQLSFLSDYLPSTITNAANVNIYIITIILMFIMALLYFRRFMSLYLSDVQLWTTHEETDKKYETRRKILEQGKSLLMHVLNDPGITRVVIVSHGLGSAIAVDSLLEVGWHNRARGGDNQQPLPLHKIDHLITMGSPIDKIHYFFESRGTGSRTYVRTVEDLRGDIGGIPFSEGNVPYVHWINFWNQGDFISGALYTPANREQPSLRVDNVHVGSFWFPRPAASHGGYFKNKTVLKHLFDIIFEHQLSFKNVPVNQHNQPVYDSVMIGPGTFQRQTIIFVWLMLWLPWLILLAIIFSLIDVSSSARDVLYLLSFLDAVILYIGWLASTLNYDYIDPVEPGE